MKSRSLCFDHALIHAKNVAAPLRLVSAKRAGRVEHAGIDEPAGAGFQAVGFREIEDAVVALVPILKALAHLRLGGAGFKAHEGVREVVADVVVLRREVIALGLAFLADELGLLLRLMHVVRNRPHVVEELRVNRPARILLPNVFAHERCAAIGDSLAQREALSAHDAVAQAFVRHAAFVGGFGGRSEPAFIDAAAIRAVGVRVVGMQLEAQPRLEKRARHPRGREAEQSARARDFGFDSFLNVLLERLEFVDVFVGHKIVGATLANHSRSDKRSYSTGGAVARAWAR
jgi:hypothetical protein